MGQCIKITINGIYPGQLPLVYGMAVGYIDTQGASANVEIKFLGDPTGTKIIDGGTFSDGTTIISSSSDTKYVVPDRLITILYPKYNCIPSMDNRYAVGSVQHSVASFNFDDAEYLQANIASVTTFRMEATRKPYTGNFDVLASKATGARRLVCSYPHPDVIGDINTIVAGKATMIQCQLEKSGISGNINTTFNEMTVIETILLQNSNVEGDRSVCFRNIMQSNKSAYKSRNNTLLFQIANSRCTDTMLGTTGSVIYQFSGTSTVTIKKSSDSSVLGTYDIDTDTFTPSN